MKTSTRPPAGVNLIAFVSRFHSTCCSRPVSPLIGSMAARPGENASSHVPGQRQRPDGIERPLRHGDEIDGLGRQAKRSRNDPRQIQQIVNHVGEGDGVALDRRDRVCRAFGRQLLRPQHA